MGKIVTQPYCSVCLQMSQCKKSNFSFTNSEWMNGFSLFLSVELSNNSSASMTTDTTFLHSKYCIYDILGYFLYPFYICRNDFFCTFAKKWQASEENVRKYNFVVELLKTEKSSYWKITTMKPLLLQPLIKNISINNRIYFNF